MPCGPNIYNTQPKTRFKTLPHLWSTIKRSGFWTGSARLDFQINVYMQTHVSTCPAVVSPAGQRVEGLLALHAHGHFIVPNPARSSLPQLFFLKNTSADEGISPSTPSTVVFMHDQSALYTYRNLIRHFFRGWFECFVLLLKDFNGLLERLESKQHTLNLFLWKLISAME